jgi:hypothetical protein
VRQMNGEVNHRPRHRETVEPHIELCMQLPGKSLLFAPAWVLIPFQVQPSGAMLPYIGLPLRCLYRASSPFPLTHPFPFPFVTPFQPLEPTFRAL